MYNPGNRLFIGLTGSLGSGCTTLSRIMEKSDFTRISLSDLIKEKFRELHRKEPTQDSYGPNWRYELQNIGNRGRNGEFGDFEGSAMHKRGYWVDLGLSRIDGTGDGPVVIDGIRNIGEVEFLRQTIPQGHFWLVAVHADYETRWKRIQKCGSYDNEHRFRRDDMRDSGEDDPMGQDVRHCVYEADYILRNEEHIEPTTHREEVLKKKMDSPLDLMRGSDSSRNPRMPEVFMATAVSQSRASRCLKRKVGAVIVNEEDNIPLSVGYNDNPIGMESCFLLYNNRCYKDMVMESKLEQMAPLYCPECGKRHERLAPLWECDGNS